MFVDLIVVGVVVGVGVVVLVVGGGVVGGC